MTFRTEKQSVNLRFIRFFHSWTTRNCNSKLYWHNDETKILHSLSHCASAVPIKLHPLLPLITHCLVRPLFSLSVVCTPSCGQPSVKGYIPNRNWQSHSQGTEYQHHSPHSISNCLLCKRFVLRALLRRKARLGPFNLRAGRWVSKFFYYYQWRFGDCKS